MNTAARLIMTVALTFAALGCRGTSIDRISDAQYPTHRRRVCILQDDLPASLAHQSLATVTVELNTYSGNRKAKRGLANAARKIGADAVMQTSFWNTMGAASGEGVAVVFTDAEPIPPSGCEWF